MPKILFVVLLASITVGYATKGRLTRMAGLRLRGLPVLYFALVPGLIPLFVTTSRVWSRVFISSAYILLALFLILNVKQPTRSLQIGVLVLCLGWLLNAAPVSLNGGMPLSLAAYRKAGITERPTPSRKGFFKIVIAQRGTTLRALGDVIPIEPIKQVVSVGDLVLALGVATVIMGGMHIKTTTTGPSSP